MSTLMDMPQVSECSVAGCSYNHDGCHAGAVTITGTGDDAQCATFIPLGYKGGLDRVISHVGARPQVGLAELARRAGLLL